MFPGLDEPPPRPLGKELHGIDDRPPVLPDNIESYTWTVTEIGGSFSTTITRQTRHAPAVAGVGVSAAHRVL